LTHVVHNLENYDSDKRIAMFGFGAILPGGEDPKIPYQKNKKTEKEEKPTEWTSHCFAMNGDVANPEVVGVEGVLGAYRKTTPIVEMWGPTCISNVIGQVNDQLEKIQEKQT
jgi:hypothetical protein